MAANIVNNANENNNNNNNNNNQDNTNSNNMNIGNSVNNNMNMNLLIPGRRSFPSYNNQTKDNIQNKVITRAHKNVIQVFQLHNRLLVFSVHF